MRRRTAREPRLSPRGGVVREPPCARTALRCRLHQCSAVQRCTVSIDLAPVEARPAVDIRSTVRLPQSPPAGPVLPSPRRPRPDRESAGHPAVRRCMRTTGTARRWCAQPPVGPRRPGLRGDDFAPRASSMSDDLSSSPDACMQRPFGTRWPPGVRAGDNEDAQRPEFMLEELAEGRRAG